MSRSINEGFYKTKQWLNCRASYLKSVQGLCERCLAKGIYTAAKHVHHKIHLTEDNVTDPAIAYGFDNLEALCQDCHNAEHFPRRRRYKVDEAGRVTVRDDPPLSTLKK